jgi:hypothetical protein
LKRRAESMTATGQSAPTASTISQFRRHDE